MAPEDKDSMRIAPAHDEIASYKRSQKKGLASKFGEVPEEHAVGVGAGTKTLLFLLVVALLGALGWSFLLNQRLQMAEKAVISYEARISDLEKRLSITDEDMTDSQASMQVKIKELDSEIRKLWDNVWKKSKAQLASHEATLKKHDVFIVGAKKQLKNNESVIKGLSDGLAKTRTMQNLVSAHEQKLAAQEGLIETTSDKLNLVTTDINKLNRRVKDNEEWVESINGFRRQVNRDINALKQVSGKAAAPQP